ncbi:MAG: hypothetical protein FIA82_12585, partial [Melioribacter sp.]|nr:hypothetical protein [Melioribacter sp.]
MIIEVFMKKISILFLLLIISASVNSQTKYLIYFKDKGVSPTNSLQKSSALFKSAEKELSERAIERRKQVMGENNYITYEDIPLNENYVNQIENLGIKIENKLKWFNAVSSYLTDSQLNTIKKLFFVERVNPVAVLKGIKEPSIPSTESQEKTGSLKKTTSLDYGGSFTQNNLSDIPTVHDLGIKGTGVYIGILDDGFSPSTYNSLKTRVVVRDSDYVHHLAHVSNQSGHGSSVFCLMAGFDPGNAIGPAYDAKFFLAETENDASETHAEEDNYAAALQDMESAGVDITSSSLGYTLFDAGQTSYTYADMNGNTTIVAQAANLAFQRGVTSFTAAGNYNNDGWWIINSPADAFNIIAVGAVNSGNILASFSLPGPTADGRIKPEIVAMGQGNYVAITDTTYGTGSGTSYATPIAAGIAALLKSCWPHLTNAQIRKIFLECGDNSGNQTNNGRGWGLISAKRIISYPNLSAVNNVYNVLNKIFINSNGVQSSTVRLNFKIGNGPNQSVSMDTVVFNNTLKYNYTLPVSPNGTTVEFYFTYQTNAGGSVEEPASGTYKFSYGSSNISNLTSVKNDGEIPSQFYLSQNYPNPFNPSTVISYRLSVISKVSLKVYDLLGREVETLVNEVQLPGSYNSQFSIR